MRVILIVLACALLASVARAAPVPADEFFMTSDGVRLHYLQTGPAAAPTIVFIPGWTMPGWIFSPQIEAFSPNYRVVTFDPRGQGVSDIPDSGYDQDRRGQDIAELLAQLGPRPVVLVGWSLGVLDALAYLHAHGDAAVAGLVLIDNSVGENPAPPPPRMLPRRHGPITSHAAFMRAFVAGMFRRPQPPAYLQRLTEAALRTPRRTRHCCALPGAARYRGSRVFRPLGRCSTSSAPAYRARADNLCVTAQTPILLFSAMRARAVRDEANRFNVLLRHFLATSLRAGQ